MLTLCQRSAAVSSRGLLLRPGSVHVRLAAAPVPEQQQHGPAAAAVAAESPINQQQSRTFLTMACVQQQQRCVSVDNINPAIKSMEYAVRGPLVIRAGVIEKELEEVRRRRRRRRRCVVNIYSPCGAHFLFCSPTCSGIPLDDDPLPLALADPTETGCEKTLQGSDPRQHWRLPCDGPAADYLHSTGKCVVCGDGVPYPGRTRWSVHAVMGTRAQHYRTEQGLRRCVRNRTLSRTNTGVAVSKQ